MRRTKKMTVAAALTALIVLLLYLGSLISVLDLVTLFVASLFIVFAVIELGGIWHWLTYAVSALLAVLLLPNKFVAWEYALIVGLLPILKSYLERLPRAIAYLLKILSFNLLYGGVLCIFFFLLDYPYEALTVFSVTVPAYAVPILLIILGNVCYLLYDVLLTRMIRLYYLKYRDRFTRWLR